jgi:hypothetical protein
MMNESTRTMSFLGAAAVSAVLAFFLAPSSPRPPSDFSDVGNPFYPEFDVANAKSLEVVSFSDKAMEPKTFRVEEKDGKWGILLDPRNETYYPADGEDRLAKTAASVINIKREQFVTRDPEQYAKFEVTDPLDKDMTKLLGRGRRVTIRSADSKDTPLADYIIGKKVPRRESDGDQIFYYVRRPDEKSVYTARLNIDLSTKFSDWIQADLLKLQGDNLVEMLSHKYTLVADQRTGRAVLKGEESNILTRDKPNDPWKLQGLDDTKEEVNQDEVNTMTRGLDDLKIIGSRTKPAQLTADLKKAGKLEIDEPAYRDLIAKGFYLMQDDKFLSSEGEVEAITDAGVKYTFRFGNAFLASEMEIETGLDSSKAKTEGESKKDESSTTKGRYVFITTDFVEQGLGPKPTPPVKPGAAKIEAPKTEEPKKDAPKAEDAKPEEKKPDETKVEEPKKDVSKAEDEKKVEEPKVEEPKKDAPKAEEVKPEAAKGEEPKAGNGACGQDEAAAKTDAQPTAKTEDAKPEQPKADSKPADAKPAPVEAPAEKTAEPAAPKAVQPPAKAATPEPKAAEPKGPTPEQLAEATYKQELAKYEQDLKAYQAKVEAGKKKVKELNARFAQWYYVISDENFQKLRLERKSLVKPKTKAEPAAGSDKPSGILPGVKLPGGILPPDLSPEGDAAPAKEEGGKPANGDKPGDKESTTDQSAPDKKPEVSKPEPTTPKDEKPATEKPAEEKPATEKPPEEKPAEVKPEEKPASEPKPM